MKTYTILLALLCCATVGATPPKPYVGKIIATPLQLEQVGDSLRVGVAFDLSDVRVMSRRSIDLVPILIGPAGFKKLQEVQVRGRADYLTTKREIKLMTPAQRALWQQKQPYAVVQGYKNKAEKRVEYRKTIAFEPWMKQAQLDIREDVSGCGNDPRAIAISRAIAKVNPIVPDPPVVVPDPFVARLAYVQPQVEQVKKRETVDEAFLSFVVADSVIRPEYKNNEAELAKLVNMLAAAGQDQMTELRGIYIIGTASPEGSYAFNMRLSQGRALSLANYLKERLDYPDSMYHIEFAGENWQGLIDSVNNSDMEYRTEVLSILTDAGITNQERKVQLRKLEQGVPYRTMFERYYPSLRQAIYKIDYHVKGFDAQQAKEVFEIDPKKLSLNELFLVANTHPEGSPRFAEVFERAAELFPEDETANLNAAVAALSRQDTVLAERYLARVGSLTSTPEYHNAVGVLAILRGDYAQAQEPLQSAAQAGLEAAQVNLNQWSKLVEYLNRK